MEWIVAIYLLSAEYPLHLLVAMVYVDVIVSDSLSLIGKSS
jgi:hypothetical protein